MATGVAIALGLDVTKRVICGAVNELFDDVDDGCKRSVKICIENKTTNHHLTEPVVYLERGTASKIIPRRIESGEHGDYKVKRTRMPMLLGGGKIHGILMYKMQKTAKNDLANHIGVYFKVPRENYFFGTNKWGVKIYDKTKLQQLGKSERIDLHDNNLLQAVRGDLQNSSKQADDSHYCINLDEFRLHVCMKTASKSELYIKIFDKQNEED